MCEDMFTYPIWKCVDITLYINRYDSSVTNHGRHHSMDPPPRATCVFVLAVRARLLRRISGTATGARGTAEPLWGLGAACVVVVAVLEAVEPNKPSSARSTASHSR